MMKQYIYSYRCVFLILCIGTLFLSCERDKDVDLTTVSVVNEQVTPSYTSAEVQCCFQTEATLRNVYLQYSSTSDFSEYGEVAMWEEEGKYCTYVGELLDNTIYYIRYVVSNRYSSVLVDDISRFQTLEPSAPTIKIDSIGDLWDTHAKAYVTMAFDGGAQISKMGICWSTQSHPTIQDNKKEVQTKTSVFDMISLRPNTTYYVRAYAENKKGISYSEEKSFITLTLPVVQTNEVTDVQSGSAILSGTLLFNGNDVTVTNGFCWSNKTAPTIKDTCVYLSTNQSSFTHQLNNLFGKNTYYVRAFAKSKIGIVYGEEKCFTTQSPTLPIVKTKRVDNISYTTANVLGDIISSGGAHLIECGVVFNTDGQPTISDNKIIGSTNIDSYKFNLTNLQTGTTYYARIYAINSIGIVYGNEISFTTLDGFSINSNKKVIFSSGNLQYHPKNDSWRFANSQLEYIGEANSKMTTTYNGWIDLFSWGTGDIPLCLYIPDCRGNYTFIDWGTNIIGNYAANTWRTLTYNEWYYILNTRTNASSLFGIAQVDGVNGLILLPDNWKCPNNIIFQSGFHILNGESYYADYQKFSTVEWNTIESTGAVFLPAAGRRGFGIKLDDINVSGVQRNGRYWSSSYYEYLAFGSDNVLLYEWDPNDGASVRLVREL